MKQFLLPLLVLLVAGFLFCCWLWGQDPYTLLAIMDTHYWRPAATALPRPAFYDTHGRLWCQRLRTATGIIQREWDAYVGRGSPLPMFGDLIAGEKKLDGAYDQTPGKWRTVVLRLYGRDGAAARDFPDTHSLLRSVVPSCSTAMFSVLEAGRCLPTHVGPNHAILRYHLGIRVPSRSCALTVAGRIRRWREGEDLLFDDTLPHSAANRSSEPRVVLFLDVPRPFATDALAARFTRYLAYHWIFPNHPLIVNAVG